MPTSWNQCVVSQAAHRPPRPHAVIGPGRDPSPAEITHLPQQQNQVFFNTTWIASDETIFLITLKSKVLSKMLPRLNRQPSRHKSRLSANLPMQPLWPSAAAPIVAPLTSSSIIRRRFGCQKVVLLYSLLVCIYYPTPPCGLSNTSPVGAFNAARRYCT